MAVPDFQSLMLPVLTATASGEISASDLRDRVAAGAKLGDNDLREMLPSGRQTIFANRTAWANVFLQRAGLIEKTGRGVYRVTPEGLQVLSEGPAKIDMTFLERFPSYVEWRQRSAAGGFAKPDRRDRGSPTVDASATPEEQMGRSYQALTGALEADLLGPGDGGLDGVINEDALGLDRVYVQAKRYGAGHAVGRPEVQAFSGSLDGVSATKGILITTGAISPAAREYVSRISKRIILIDGMELSRLMVEKEIGVRVTEIYKIRKIDENYFTE